MAERNIRSGLSSETERGGSLLFLLLYKGRRGCPLNSSITCRIVSAFLEASPRSLPKVSSVTVGNVHANNFDVSQTGFSDQNRASGGPRRNKFRFCCYRCLRHSRKQRRFDFHTIRACLFSRPGVSSWRCWSETAAIRAHLLSAGSAPTHYTSSRVRLPPLF